MIRGQHDPDRRAAMQAVIQRLTPRWVTAWCVVSHVGLIVWLVIFIVYPSPTGIYETVLNVCGAVVVLGVGVSMYLRARIGFGRACAAIPCCPACLYDLRGIPPEPDGCTICPECAGAWQLPEPADA